MQPARRPALLLHLPSLRLRTDAADSSASAGEVELLAHDQGIRAVRVVAGYASNGVVSQMLVEGLGAAIVRRHLERHRDTAYAGRIRLAGLHQQAAQPVAAQLRRYIDGDEVTHLAAGLQLPVDDAE